jgi:hypothetical protein
MATGQQLAVINVLVNAGVATAVTFRSRTSR